MEEYSKLTMKSLLLFAAALASCLLFSSCGKDHGPFKWNASKERPAEPVQVAAR